MVLTWLSAPVRPRVIKARARYRRLRSRCRSQSTTVDRPRARKLRLTTACTRCSAAVIETTVPRETQKNDACMGGGEATRPAIRFPARGDGTNERYHRGGPRSEERRVG